MGLATPFEENEFLCLIYATQQPVPASGTHCKQDIKVNPTINIGI